MKQNLLILKYAADEFQITSADTILMFEND